MHTKILRRIATLPIIREVLGAAIGCSGALALYMVFTFVRDLIGVGPVDAVGSRLHGAATLVMAQGTATLGLASIMALAGACAFIHHRTMSRID